MNIFNVKRRELLIFFFAFIGVTFLIICQPFGLYFLCDDFAHVPASYNFSLLQTHLLRPIVYLSLWLDIKIWGMRAVGFHTSNLIFHLLNCFLVFLVSKEFYLKFYSSRGNQILMSAFTTVLFLVYAFHSEPIFWIVGRDSTLVTIFILISIYFFLKESKLGMLISLLSFSVALFTYELSWILPLLITLILGYEIFLGQKKKFFQVTPYWIILLVYIIARYVVLDLPYKGYAGAVFDIRSVPIYTYNFFTLIARLFLPPTESTLVFCIICFLFLLFSLGTIFKISKKKEEFLPSLLLVFCIFICLIPVIPLGTDTHDTESERFLYPASVFASILIIRVLNLIFPQRFIFVSAFAIVLHLFFLQKAADSYRYASYVSEFMMRSINQVGKVQKITFFDLPSQYRGALLFRIGFPIKTAGILKRDPEEIEILSVKEIEHPKVLTTDFKNWKVGKQNLVVEFRKGTFYFR